MGRVPYRRAILVRIRVRQEPVAVRQYSHRYRSHDHQGETADHQQGEPEPGCLHTISRRVILSPTSNICNHYWTRLIHEVLSSMLFLTRSNSPNIAPPLKQPQFFMLSNFGRAIDESGCSLVTEWSRHSQTVPPYGFQFPGIKVAPGLQYAAFFPHAN